MTTLPEEPEDQNPWFNCSKQRDIAILRVLNHAFDAGTDLNVKNAFFAALEHLEHIPGIVSLLFLNAPGVLDAVYYADFVKRTQEGAKSGNVSQQSLLFSREENAINQFLEHICQSQKVTAIGLQGEIAAPSLGIALAYDFRFATHATTFVLAQPDLGLPPGGALPFFLPRYVGQGKAAELLLSKPQLSAQEACDLGLINDVFPEQTFEALCLECVHALSQSANVLSHTKALLYDERLEALTVYLEHEYHIMEQAWADSSKSA